MGHIYSSAAGVLDALYPVAAELFPEHYPKPEDEIPLRFLSEMYRDSLEPEAFFKNHIGPLFSGLYNNAYQEFMSAPSSAQQKFMQAYDAERNRARPASYYREFKHSLPHLALLFSYNAMLNRQRDEFPFRDTLSGSMLDYATYNKLFKPMFNALQESSFDDTFKVVKGLSLFRRTYDETFADSGYEYELILGSCIRELAEFNLLGYMLPNMSEKEIEQYKASLHPHIDYLRKLVRLVGAHV